MSTDKSMATDFVALTWPSPPTFHLLFHRRRYRVPVSLANVFPNDTSTKSSLFVLVDVDVNLYVGPPASSRIHSKHLLVSHGVGLVMGTYYML